MICNIILYTCLLLCYPCLQIEVFCQFFIAYYDSSGTYVDSIALVAKRYTMSITAFWFDITTSLPWSYLDVYAYQVPLDCSSLSAF